MKIEIIKPLFPDDFIKKVKVDENSIGKNYKAIFQFEIEHAVQFAVGPFFWFIPDNTQSKIVAVSSNVNLQTPHNEIDWLNADVHLFANIIHPDDRFYVLSSIQKAMEIFEGMPAKQRSKIGLNIYGRLLDTKKNFVWRLIQFPGLYFNEENRVESALLMISDLSHIGQISKTMMTIIDNNIDICQFYVIPKDGNKLEATNLPKISSRERQIIQLMANGLTSQEIADKLNLAFYTIENHKRNLREKTKTKSAAELMNFVLTNNLL
jgi:DNA-binding CsgD family transcriptional regulator